MTHYTHPQCATCKYLMTKIEIGHDDAKAPWYHRFLQVIGFLKDGPLGPPTIDQYLFCRNSQNANFEPTYASNWCAGYTPRQGLLANYYLQQAHQFLTPTDLVLELELYVPDPRYAAEWQQALAAFKRQIKADLVNSIDRS